MTPHEVADEYAKNYGIHPVGITVLGGRPYVNILGLREILRHRCERENLLISRVATENIERPTEANNFVAGYRAVVELWDRTSYMTALQTVTTGANTPGGLTPQILESIINGFRMAFASEGWHSMKNEDMGTIRDPQNVAMKAETKAIARALRNAVNLAIEVAEEASTTGETEEPIIIEHLPTPELAHQPAERIEVAPTGIPEGKPARGRGRPRKVDTVAPVEEPEVATTPKDLLEGNNTVHEPLATTANNGDLTTLHHRLEELRLRAGIDDARYTQTLQTLFSVSATHELDLKSTKVAISRLLKKLQPQE